MDTVVFEDLLARCEDREEFRAIFQTYHNLFKSWKTRMGELRKIHHLNAKEIATGCGTSPRTARTFFSKIPTKREYVLMLALLMGFTIDQTNDLLSRYAHYNKLYPKNANDVIWCFLLKTKSGSRNPKALFDRYYAVYMDMLRESGDLPTTVYSTDLAWDMVYSGINAAQKDDALDIFKDTMRTLHASFATGNQRLLDHIDGIFRDSSEMTGHRVTPNSQFSDDLHWITAYYRRIQALKEKRMVPDRGFLISFALRMNQDMDQINSLLDAAGMSPLCAKDVIDAVVIFHMEELKLNFPVLFPSSRVRIGDLFDELMNYSQRDEEARISRGNESFLYDGIALDRDDMPTEGIHDYLSRMLREQSELFALDYADNDYFRSLTEDFA